MMILFISVKSKQNDGFNTRSNIKQKQNDK
jgi:hypothetical protein